MAEIQIGGTHYQEMKIEPFDYAFANDLDFFQGTIVKYISRHKTKNGIEDLKKARHTLNRYIEYLETEIVK